jgi:hypothetical protein
MKSSEEVKIREYCDLASYLGELCGKGRKLTGSAAAPKPESQRALEIYRRLL